MITGWPAVPLWFHFWPNNLFLVVRSLKSINVLMQECRYRLLPRVMFNFSAHKGSLLIHVCAYVLLWECVCVWSGLYTVMTVMHLIAVPRSFGNLSGYLRRVQWESVWHARNTDLWWIGSFKNTLNFCSHGDNGIWWFCSHSFSLLLSLYPSSALFFLTHASENKRSSRNTNEDAHTHWAHAPIHTHIFATGQARTCKHRHMK